ncbi:MAG: sulfite exporter TauE/SafE family protein [Desulfarculaceae bacterium]|nr:sulfite exporter TauE/SafE family protein [Desulfarculaceae bacterium]MCF8070788.1 sulfite exporter TauE/SafE family protein [Desulfarculaceae bacterium]MCF8102225.1 sulfite exporter TauE/SafE family protein [Desulfarculaceae bacterium]MCF8116976.1 sulfite exporter TauE/SafE family protein [Desulfarculaceae bacterium]
MEAIIPWLVFAGVGAVAGVLAGLLGVGGGLVMVPAVVFYLEAAGTAPQHVLHLALGTSLAIIVFTSISSFRAHHRRGAVVWPIVTKITGGILVGTYAGSYLAAQLSTRFLTIFFVAFLYLVALQMLLEIKPKPSRTIPGWPGTSLAGLTIGGLSALVGIGGGSMSVPFMSWCNVPIHRAIGTSAAIGLPIALAGAAGYVVNGWGVAGLPPHTLGFVYLPALIGVAAVSVFFAPLGARLAHKLPTGLLKKVFAAFIVLVGTKMLWSLF